MDTAVTPSGLGQARSSLAARDTGHSGDHPRAEGSRRRSRHTPSEVLLSPALLATAYDGVTTRALVELARGARATDDSTIGNYDEESLDRFSVWIRLGVLARERLLFRRDRAEHVRWQRGLGALVDVLGSRQVLPAASGTEVEESNEAIALPYVPGRRTLALGGQRGADTTQYTDIDDIIDPLATGAEAYYRYQQGDSATVSVPARAGGQQVIHLREIQLHPRRPVWNISIGSLWFDVATGHLVRAVYRFAAPMDVVAVAKDADPHAFDDVPFWVRPMITPMTATLDGVTLEYGLLNGRFWLPIARYAEGNAQVSMMSARVQWEVRYRYRSVNGPDTLPRLAEFSPPLPADTAGRGAGVPPKANTRARREKGSEHLDLRSGASRDDEPDSVEHARRMAECTQQASWQHVEVHDGGAARVVVRTPCDTAALARSPELPTSSAESVALFDVRAAHEVLAQLASAPLPDWSPRPVQLRWGLEDALVRYNRIEGLSAGVAMVDELGLGLSARVEGRLGEADLQPNGELVLTRAGALGTMSGAVYRRLASANDWGDPFAVGSSVWNFLFGGDEGFYYRAWGGELRGTQPAAALPFSWRLFAEREWTARVATRFSLSDAAGGAAMSARNLSTRAGTLTGLSFRVRPTWGADPEGFRALVDLRGEGAGGVDTYIRGAADLTLMHPITRYAEGALTGGAGTSAGDVPAQRLWYLGGLRTVRGIAPGQQIGDAYWMGHAEIAVGRGILRPIAFYDIGWAGDRGLWAQQGRPLSGAGLGASVLDGLIRLDAARGLSPTHGVRINAYWQGTF